MDTSAWRWSAALSLALTLVNPVLLTQAAPAREAQTEVQRVERLGASRPWSPDAPRQVSARPPRLAPLPGWPSRPGSTTPERDEEPSSGAPGVGDRLYPRLGNGGYTVDRYDISLDYQAHDQPLDAFTKIHARTTRALRRFDLDFAHGRVRSVTVAGSPAVFRTVDEELVITPATPLARGDTVDIAIRHTSDPRGTARNLGWVRTRDGLVMANQADAAHRVFPCNDHPSDKAQFIFRVTTPDDQTVVASGRLSAPMPKNARRRHSIGRTGWTLARRSAGPAQPGDGLANGDGGARSRQRPIRGATTIRPNRHPTDKHQARVTWTYRTVHPMATELAQVAIGNFTIAKRTGPHGLPLRDAVGSQDRARLAPLLARTPSHLEWLERRLGRFPLETYGVLSAATDLGFSLETQTLSLFARNDLVPAAGRVEPLMVHELAHQWFGDSVSPATWSDLWLNEGHATWYQWNYAADHGDLDLVRMLREAYTADQGVRRTTGPPAAPRPPQPGDKISILRRNVYAGGALALYALRQEIGARRFTALEKAWVRRYHDRSATTADFITLASDTAGRDLGPYLRAWLYGRTTPPMPGHPDWTGNRAAAAPAARLSWPRSPQIGMTVAAGRATIETTGRTRRIRRGGTARNSP